LGWSNILEKNISTDIRWLSHRKLAQGTLSILRTTPSLEVCSEVMLGINGLLSGLIPSSSFGVLARISLGEKSIAKSKPHSSSLKLSFSGRMLGPSTVLELLGEEKIGSKKDLPDIVSFCSESSVSTKENERSQEAYP